jgi:hypothetical protein
MLCGLCEQLDGQQILLSSTCVNHHKTYSDLTLSANQGCGFSNVAHVTVLNTYSEKMSLPIEDVMQLHLEQDRLESQRREKDRSRFTLKSRRVHLDTRFAPFGEGSIGFVYGDSCLKGLTWEMFAQPTLFRL